MVPTRTAIRLGHDAAGEGCVVASPGPSTTGGESGANANGGCIIIFQEIILSLDVAISAYVTADLLWWVLERVW